MREKEKPDLVIGLFHSGTDFTYGGATAATPSNENASSARRRRGCAGFDLILTGHDHAATNKVVKDPDGKDVHIFGAQNAARNVAVGHGHPHLERRDASRGTRRSRRGEAAHGRPRGR